MSTNNIHRKLIAPFELVNNHSVGSLRNIVQGFHSRYHGLGCIMPQVERQPPRTEGLVLPLDLSCCVHCYRLSGLLVSVSVSEARYHMKKYGTASFLYKPPFFF